MKHVEIFTDGACRGNPGPGGWGALLRYDNKERELFGGEPDTTNNRMEMMAVIAALEALQRDCSVKITTDSQYVMKGMLEWLPGWKKRNWKTAAKKPVKNEDLWRRLDDALADHEIDFRWVKGHSGNIENDIADELATSAIKNN